MYFVALYTRKWCCYGNNGVGKSRGAAITGLTTVKLIGTHRTTALGESEMSYLNALILTPNSAIAVEYDAEYGGTTGIMEIDCFFHFEDIGAR